MRPLRNRPWSTQAPAILRGVALSLILSAVATAQDPRPMSRRVPADDLFVYVEFDGLDAHAGDWKGSAAYRALNQTTLGSLLEDLAAQGLDLALKGRIPDPPPGSRVVQSIEFLARKGFAVGVNGKSPGAPTFVIVARGGSGPEVAGLLQALQGGGGKVATKTVQEGSRKVTTIGDDAFIDDKGDLVLVTVPNVDKALAVLDGKVPNASTHPSLVELAKAEGAFRPVALAFVDPKVFAPLPPPLVALGIDGLKRVDYRWGFRGTALYSVLRLVAPSPRRGVLGLFDGPTFDKSTLPALPSGVNGFTAVAMSPAQVHDKLLAIVRKSAPDGQRQVDALQKQWNQTLGVRLREDLLARLGPKWSMYAVPVDEPGGPPFDVVALAELTDSTRFSGSLGQVLQVANDHINAGGGPNAAKGPRPQFRKLAGNQLGYELVLPPGMLPPGPMSGLKPTILVGKRFLAIASTPTAGSSALAVAEGNAPRWKPDAVYGPVLDSLPTGMVMLSVSDPRQSLPQFIGSLPALLASANQAQGKQGGPAIPIKVDPAKIPPPAELSSKLFPASNAMSVDAKGISLATRESLPSIGNPAASAVAVALLLPAVQAAREAARRTQCTNNLRQIGLAFHNYNAALEHFPGNITDKQGKPLLSWRVAILPYIEQEPLYRRFKLDEPWDSPSNKPLLKEMPLSYACPSRPSPEPGLTPYQGWNGPMALFGGPKPPSIAAIIDGTVNTIAVAEARVAVPWTRPDDLPFDPKSPAPLLGAGSTHPGGFNALFADGSVRFLKATIDPATLRALITINGSEIIAPGKF
jgi:prepilin-type processing-associated H-X9-DG protein